MANGGRIDFTVGFKVDEAGITKIRHELEQLSKMSATSIQKANPDLSMNEARGALIKIRQAVTEVQGAMNKAFDTKTGVMNLQKLHTSLQSLNLKQVQQAFAQAGTTGQSAFLGISKAALTTNVQLKNTQTIADKLGTTLINTLKWNISSSMINKFTGAFQQAYGYVQHLDTSLNDIRIVTGKSADEMTRFGEQANKAAKDLGKATTDYTEAALIYYQQGLADEEVQARAETTLKASNVTGQSASEVSEQLTAVWNGYKVSAEETEIAVDKLAAVAATTAADLEELSKGMSKVASAANSMGVDMDQLNATIATIESVTRQAPESVGTALKTIYARMGDLKVGKSDEDGVKLGEVSSTLQKVGIEILDVNGDLRDMGTVMEEIGTKWDNWSKAEQQAIAIAVAGKRQYNNLFALFDNWDMYIDALETSRNSMGTLQKQQDIYMQSTAAHVQQLKTEWEDLYDSILSTKTINSSLTVLTKILDIITSIVDATGGLKGIITAVVGLMGTRLSKQIANSFAPMIENLNAVSKNKAILEQLKANIDYQKQTKAISGEAAEAMAKAQDTMSKYWSVMTEEEINASQNTIREIGDWTDKKVAIDEATQSMKQYFEQYGDQRSKNIVTDQSRLDAQGNANILGYQQGNADTNYLIQRLEKVSKYGELAEQRVKKLGQAMDAVNEASGKNLSGATESQLKNVQKQVNSIQKAMSKLHNQGLIDDTQLQRSSTILTEIEKRIEDIRDPKKKNVTGFTEKMVNDLEQLSNISGVASSEIQQYLDVLRNGDSTVQDIEAAIKGLNAALHENELNTRLTIQTISQLIGAASSLYYAFSALGNIGSIITDDDLDAGEKLKRVFGAIVMGLPMLINGLASASTAIKAMTGAETVGAAVTQLFSGAMVAASGSTNLLTGAITALSTAIKSIPVIGWILAAIAVAITAITAAVKVHQQALENDMKAAQDSAKAQQEIIDKRKEEKDAIDSLSKSYQEILKQRDEEGNLTQEQIAQIYDLVKAYGNQDLILKAIAGDYNSLTEAIEGYQAGIQEDYLEELQKGETKYKTALENTIIANAKSNQRDSGGFDLSGLGGIVNKHKDFRKDLQELLGESEDVIDESGHISYDKLIKLLTAETKDVQDFLEKYKDLKASTQIRELLSENSDLIDKLKSNEDELTKAQLDNLGYSHLDEIKAISDVAEYSEQVEKLVAEALAKKYVKTQEEGREWAKNFMSGVSDELSSLDDKETIFNSLKEQLYKPDPIEEREIKDQLRKYQEGGTVDLTKRGIRLNEDGSYSTVETQGFGDDEVGYFNFTPIIVDKDGNYVRTLSDDDLKDYVNGIIYDSQPDIYNLQIGAKFDTVEEADAAAERIHELQAELYDYDAKSKQILEQLNEIPEESQKLLIGNETLFKAMIQQGYSVEDIFNNLTESIDILTHENHIVKINTVLDGDIKKEKDLKALFEDTDIDLGIDESNFKLLDKSDQYNLLLNQSRKEIEAVEQLSDAEKKRIKERGEALTKEIEDVSNAISDFAEKGRQDAQKEVEQLQTDFFYKKDGAGYAYIESIGRSLGITDEEGISKLQQDLSDTLDILSQFYDEAEARGEDGAKAIAENWDELIKDETVKKYLDEFVYLETNRGGGGNPIDTQEQMIKKWSESKKPLEEFNEELETEEEYLEKLQNTYDDLLDTNIDYAKRVTQVKQAMSALNKDIDSIQSAYQSLQSIVKDYNDDHRLTLDNLQSLLELDDSYVASLQFENGQMVLNEAASRALIDAKLEQAKLDAAELYMDELKVIAEGNVVTATGAAIAANKAEAESLGTLVEAAYEGVDALMQLADAKAAAAKDPEQTREATQAFYNRIQLIDSMANQSTSQLLGKADKSSKSSKEKEAEHVDNLERETDLYRKINMELDDIEKTLGRIQNIESHEWGIDYQKSLEEENDLLDKQLDKLKQKKAIQEQDLSIRRKQLEDIGVSFNAEGSVMNNAEETLNSLYANYNAMTAKYNAMSAEQQKGFKATLETEKDRIEKIEKKMSEYESTFSDYQSTLDSLLEAHYAEIENEVKKFNNMVEVHLELSEAKREWNDFWYDVVQDLDDDDFTKQIEKSFSKLDSLILGTDNDVSVLTGHLNDTVTEVEALIASANRGGEDSLFGDDTAAAKENLEDYRDKLMKALTEAKEEVDNISENYIKMLEHAQDLIDDQVDGWESIGDHLEHNMELIKLVSGDKAFDALNNQYEKQYQNNLNLINAQKQSQDFWAGEIERYKQLLEVTDENTVQWKTYSEALEKASENYKQAVEDLDKTVEEALKNLEDWRKNQSDAIMDAIDKAMSGGLGLDLVEQEWKLINDQAGKYLDNVQRAYSMEEYANELDKAANATGLSATNQAKLNAFREQELAQLREKDKLTKYDIEESRARLAILQQQLALEDAQRNKSNMRLRRDSQGNYTYQYTADENAVDEAEGGLLNAKKEWYELVKARRKETNDWIIEAEKNLASILAQIDEAEKAGDVDRLNKLKDMELLIRQEVQDAYAEAGKNIQDIYNGVAIYFADVNNAAILPENAAVVSQLIKDWAGEGEESFLGAVKKALIDITGLQEEFGRKTEAILEEAGINYTKLKEKGIDPVDESLEDLQMDNEDLAIALEDVNDQLTTQEGNLRQVEAAYYALQSAAVSAIQSANAALVALAQTAVQTQMQVAAAIAAARNAAAITGYYNSQGSSTGGGNEGGSGNSPFSNYQGNIGHVYSVGDYTYAGGKRQYYLTIGGQQVGGYIASDSVGNAVEEFRKKYKNNNIISGYATGGYTGAWPGSDGKLAVLHQKELVLNESDTKNILGAVEAIRALDFNGVAKSLVQSANIQAQVLASVGESVLQALNVNQGDSVSNYRNVTVNADFSGVRSADAIYQALMELENTGMQTSFAN